ncbi:Uma2 family endonuclease [Paraliomyxa miuraensis]|uniref:Uma2 family endonuclease n=1 Tax=Paraliomyxa miuraensis TaxID=376150 RepID=UPI00225656BA|nr:Uma2 family endonuclease [Paraliomyxa miuraensis]MCX4242674.1 Uma2 family endonuclease [Paraliomyxa miuraensis]
MAEPAQHVSYAEYLEFIEHAELKHEYIDGVVVAMAGGTIEHSRLVARTSYLLQQALEGKPCNVFSSDGRVRIEATNRSTYPDVSVVCGSVQAAGDDPQGISNPVVLVEVLSDSTEKDDRGSKFAHYRRLPSLREYVLVAQDAPRVEVFVREGEQWVFREHGPGQEVELTSLGVTLAVDRLYADPTRA